MLLLCILMKIVWHACAKMKTKRLKGFKFLVGFQGFQIWSFLSDIMAVKGLTVSALLYKVVKNLRMFWSNITLL